MLPAGEPSGRLRKRIGKYSIVGRIGRGGMGMVYRGLDEVLEREVAVKTLTVEGTLDEESRQRFQIEAKAAAKLQHPNIVTVFELGEDRGLPYIVMELLPGVDLETLVRSGETLLLQEQLEIVAQVLRGLQFAHDHGIVHRDVKPSNIRLLEDGTAKIMDFGIAKLGGTGVTKTGMMVGTIHYMSPEQIRGRPLDGRSDVFSAGVILFELLAGRRPFVGETPTAVLYRIVHDPTPDLDPEILGAAPGLKDILHRALAKDPEDRPTAGALADELAQLVQKLKGRAGTVAEVAEGVAAARRMVKDGRVEEALGRLGELSERHPDALDVRRALRTATREVQRRQRPREPERDEFPELDATYQAAPTRRNEVEPATVVASAPAARPGPSSAEVLVPGASTPASARRLIWGAAGVLAIVAVLGMGLLWRGRRPVAPVRLAVQSEPVGAQVFVDGRDTGLVTDAEVTLPDSRAEQVVVAFRKTGYREENRTLRLPYAGPPLRVVLAPLTPTVSSGSSEVILALTSDPVGATVTLDGERLKGVTPVTLAMDPARDHRIVLALEGYSSQEVKVGAGTAPPELKVVLPPAGPVGRVAIRSSYPVDVMWKGRTLARAQTEGQVSLPAGRQVVTLVSSQYFLRLNANVDVPSSGAAALDAPPLGRLNIRANPDNCQVLIDGAFVDYPPILDRPVAAGTHRVSFKWPDGVLREETVDVTRTSPAYVMGRKD